MSLKFESKELMLQKFSRQILDWVFSVTSRTYEEKYSIP